MPSSSHHHTDIPVITADEIFADPAASFWIKSALRAALDRDPVDAANDAEVLAAVLHSRIPALRE